MNMSYCRYQNTLTDLRDCVNDFNTRCDGEADEHLSQDEFEALCQIALQGQKLINRIRERGTFDTDQDLTSDEIHDVIANIDQHACDNAEED